MNAPAPCPDSSLRLVRAVQDLSLARNVDEVVAIVRRAARELTGADGATVVLREHDMCHYVDEDAIAPLWKGRRFPMSLCISGWVMRHRASVAIEDIYADARVPTEAYRPTFVKSLAMVPIRSADPVGAIGNYWAAPHQVHPGELQLLQALADSTSIALENLRLIADMEQRVRDRTRELEHANRELEAFSYSVSHDLRAPLRLIRSYSGFLREDGAFAPGSTAEDHARRIHDAALQMGALIDALLALAGVTRAELVREPLDLSRMAAQIVAQLRAESLPRDVRVDIEPGLRAVGDPALVHAALQNLVGNAWKYTSREPDAHIRVGCELDGDGARVFFVADNGAGFDMARVDRIFRPFGRLHRNEEYPGTGVGLATVQRIIHRHGGQIWAQAKPGSGATFRFTLPGRTRDD